MNAESHPADDTLIRHLRAGIAIYNAGEYHAAHDAWEDHWLALDRDTLDERFLHGLIQFTAAVYHGHNANWEGLRGLAESAGEYLADLPATYRGVDVDAVRAYLAALAVDPEHIERATVPKIRYDSEPLGLADLGFPELVVAAGVFAEETPAYDEAVIQLAATYAQRALDDGDHNRFVTLVRDFVTDPARRDLVFDRLESHVSRERSRDEDVAGLFDDDPAL